MSRGVTLVELLLVLALTGIVLVLAVPSLATQRDRLAVDAAVSAITAAHVRARVLARTERRVVILALAPDSIVLRVVAAPGDTVPRWHGPGPAREGVATTGLPRVVHFTPSGVTMGVANATYRVTRGGSSRQVIVSRYGRVRVV
jgi:prepilin-type N-terminal cleavage/methylation domain-containing protein